MPIIEQFHTHDINWLLCVEGVILDPRGDVPFVIIVSARSELVRYSALS